MYGICWSILLMMIGLGVILSAEYYTYILVYVGVSIELFSVALLIFFIDSSKNKKAALIEKRKEEQEKAQIEKEKIEQQEPREKAALKIYKKCSENDIMDFNSKKNCESLLLIANSFGIEDLEEAKEMRKRDGPLWINLNFFKDTEEYLDKQDAF